MMIIDCKTIARSIYKEVALGVQDFDSPPGLGIVLANSTPGSEIYVNRKIKACREVGITTTLCKWDHQNSPKDFAFKSIQTLSERDDIHGIMLQLPIKDCPEPQFLFDRIDPRKDVDCLNPINVGRLVLGMPGVLPCTPQAIVHILREVGVDFPGKVVTVVNNSNIVGKPLSMMLTQLGATVSICEHRSNHYDVFRLCLNSDIMVVAVGIPDFVQASWVHHKHILVDVGITRKNGRVVGDIHPDANHKAGMYTSVPGGVGLVTVAMLLKNTIKCRRS